MAKLVTFTWYNEQGGALSVNRGWMVNAIKKILCIPRLLAWGVACTDRGKATRYFFSINMFHLQITWQFFLFKKGVCGYIFDK